jgi:UDP-N-acetylmuramoylalanine--D-glutamate ligase
MKAIESFPGNIHLILGGKDKDSDYTLMNHLLRERVKRVYTIGSAAEKIRVHVQSAVEVLPCKTLDNAVDRAHDLAKPGDIVLLAPACSSFDQFENYEHRGRTFRALVERLATPAAAQPERR